MKHFFQGSPILFFLFYFQFYTAEMETQISLYREQYELYEHTFLWLTR